ncbi:hypothetical protein SteCoe_10193 [Stentor coeruleus]|uniref:Uncharacterized protein n=1 Tax=Stentor coeruleus TaxID=5963 RepID=A0A1R2CG07_9CILI|nr:hypothetical protein SteCoe_10193 [Stentor coeruleus]
MPSNDQIDSSTSSSEESHPTQKKQENLTQSVPKAIKKLTAVEKFFKPIKSKKPQYHIKISSPKKEYIRCKLIRGTKKSIRILNKSSFPNKLGNFEGISPQTLTNWNAMMNYFTENKHVLKEFSSTQNKIPDKEIRSYNLKFCKMFFERLEVREAFMLYIEFLFSDYDCLRLCREFNFQCCRTLRHTQQCGKRWEELKNFILNDMMEEIGFTFEEEKVVVEEVEEREEKEEKVEIIKEVEKVRAESLMCVEIQPKWIQKMMFKEYLIL